MMISQLPSYSRGGPIAKIRRYFAFSASEIEIKCGAFLFSFIPVILYNWTLAFLIFCSFFGDAAVVSATATAFVWL